MPQGADLCQRPDGKRVRQPNPTSNPRNFAQNLLEPVALRPIPPSSYPKRSLLERGIVVDHRGGFP